MHSRRRPSPLSLPLSSHCFLFRDFHHCATDSASPITLTTAPVHDARTQRAESDPSTRRLVLPWKRILTTEERRPPENNQPRQIHGHNSKLRRVQLQEMPLYSTRPTRSNNFLRTNIYGGAMTGGDSESNTDNEGIMTDRAGLGTGRRGCHLS